jgi:hypothetical protein
VTRSGTRLIPTPGSPTCIEAPPILESNAGEGESLIHRCLTGPVGIRSKLVSMPTEFRVREPLPFRSITRARGAFFA